MSENERKYLIMINKYKETITDLEIKCATFQVVIEDLRAELDQLKDNTKGKTPQPETVEADPDPEPAQLKKK